MSRVTAAVGETVATMLAVVLSVVTALLLAPEPGPAVLGGMLAITLSRSQLERDARGRVEAAIAMPVIGVLAAGTGALLLAAPIAGAAAYTLALALGAWIRRLGPVWRRLGALLMLPFTALLVAPDAVPGSGVLAGAGITWLVPVIVPAAAFGWVTVVQLAWAHSPVAERPSTGSGTAKQVEAPRVEAPPTGEAEAPRLLPSDRAAIQLALALVLAFAAGFLLFPDHWTWVVLTVVVVLAGATGRADALYKGVSRFVGAALGSALAVLLTEFATAGGADALPLGWRIGIIALALAAGVFARRFAYVWWALCFTLVLALVQSFGPAVDGRAGGFLLWERLLEILVGAVIAIAVAWFVVPLVSERTIRRRLGGVLAALQPVAAGEVQADAALDAALRDLERSTEPYDFVLRFRPNARHPRAARWIATTRECAAVARGGASPGARRALGEARRALREPERLQGALDGLLAELRR